MRLPGVALLMALGSLVAAGVLLFLKLRPDRPASRRRARGHRSRAQGRHRMIEAIQNSAYAVWVRESPSILAFTTILSLHAMGLAIVVGINTVVALRLLGFVPEIPVRSLRKLCPWMYFGFTVNALSGLSLLAANLHERHRTTGCSSSSSR